MQTSTLRPGILVSLKSSVRGNVKYDKRDIERDHTNKKGQRVAKWETTRNIADPKEFELATTTRASAVQVIRSTCVGSVFGMLCPEAESAQLAEAIATAEKMCAEFNAKARITRIGVYALTGRIAPDDVAAVKAINSEVRDLLSDMQDGLRNLDVKAVRQAAQKARGIGNMLSPDAQARIQVAIDAARKSAKRIVKASETAAAEIDRATIKRIQEQRVAFLDLDEGKAIAKPKTKGRAVELDVDAKYEKRAKLQEALDEAEAFDLPANETPTLRKPRARARQLQLD